MSLPHYLSNELLVNEIGRSLSGKDPIFPSREDIRKIGPINTLREFKHLGLQSLRVLLNYTNISPSSAVLDIGSGYGRLAIPLSRFLSTDGSYVGIDVMQDAVVDCRQRISNEFDQFTFEHLDVHNGIYNADTSQAAADARFDLPDQQFDVVFMFSVFSHMMPEDVSAYLSEIARVLKPGGMLMTTFFVLNNFSRTQIENGETRRTFAHKHGHVFVDDSLHPETAVAYEQSYLEEILAASPLEHVHTFYGQWAGHRWSMTGQDAVICVKP
ncbi:MAG: class I SAM-dependent methyltransferase [Halioglobus sp.]